MARRFMFVCFAILALAPATAVAQPGTIVPYSTCGWKYLVGAVGSTTALSALTLDDSGWVDGCAPFVAPWGCLPGTAVPENYRVVMRRHILNQGSQTILYYRVKGRWSLATAWNGHEGNSGNFPNECPVTYELTGLFPLSPGDNVFLVDFGSFTNQFGQSYGGQADASLSVDDITLAPVQTWGALKIRYR